MKPTQRSSSESFIEGNVDFVTEREQRKFSMPIPLRADFDTMGLRSCAKSTKDGSNTMISGVVSVNYHGEGYPSDADGIPGTRF